MARHKLPFKTGILTKVNLKTATCMVMEFIILQMELCLMGIFTVGFSMGIAKYLILKNPLSM
jgi:hypothetical protein